MAKNIFQDDTGKFKSNDSTSTQKNARIHAKKGLPRLEVGGKSKPLSNKAFSIGRDKSNQIIVADPKVSRYHALVTYKNNQAYLKDTGSSNGTYLNGNLIPPNKAVALENGDKIKVGRTVIIYYR
ncbi:MAG: FHA domain-containing protein [Spirochaetes bacterium]|nr:FHA domain-containing protein [Spirochaetota bacterium]